MITYFDATMFSLLSRKEVGQRFIELSGILKHREMADTGQHHETPAWYREGHFSGVIAFDNFIVLAV